MRSRRSTQPRSTVAGAAVLAAAVIGGVLSTTPSAVAAPATPAPAAGNDDGERHGGAERTPESRLFPRPQSVRASGSPVRVSATVTLVAAPTADPHALNVVRQALRAAGASDVRTLTQGTPLPGGGLVVLVDGPQALNALRALKAPSAKDLPAGGYVLAAGRPPNGGSEETIALAGSDAAGTYHAAQTLRQLLDKDSRTVPGLIVRDWPGTQVRGVVEGFYGQPWSQRERLAQLDFLGRTKQNRYLYAPGGDPYRQTQWREEYPKAQRDQFRTLAARAARNHVTLAWAVSPGQSLCFSSPEDLTALAVKLESQWRLGFRAFQLQFQDISYAEWHCDGDRARFGTGPAAAARAQAHVANEVAKRLRDRHPEASGLSVLPTEFYQNGRTPYRTALAKALHPSVTVAWTGVGVVPRKITGEQVQAATAAFDHPLVTMDNYPVNDFADDRVFLGPYSGREPALSQVSAELLANAMRQPAASRIALFTSADFSWNARGYDPAASWRAALRDLAGGDEEARAALTVLAANCASSALNKTESAYLKPLLQEFWAAFEAERPARLPQTAGALGKAFDDMAAVPARLARVADGEIADELRPWTAQLARYGKAGRAAVDMLNAQRRGDGDRAWKAQLTVRRLMRELDQSTATVGRGVLGPFLEHALKAANSWTGVSTEGRKATSTMGAARKSDPSLMLDGSPSTFYWTDAPPQPGDTFGVHLGAARQVGEIRVEMGGRGAAVDDYLRDAVLEYSDGDGGGWRRVGAFNDQRTITASLPEGTVAREVRLRATKQATTKVAVRTFTVTAPGAVRPRVTGGPAALPGSSLRSAADGDPETAYRAAAAPSADGSSGPGSLTVRFGATRPLDKVTVLTSPGVPVRASVEAHVPGEGWSALGGLHDGWTELAARGREADSVRLSWAADTPPPTVHEIVPWFADAPAARLDLRRTAVDVEIDGSPATINVDLEATRADASRGKVAASPPKGVQAEIPGGVVLHRGGRLTVPLKVTVPKGTRPGVYEVPIRFEAGGRTIEERVHVRAYPPTDGPDLAKGATAVSSGDETPDFPASAVNDGDPATRWSSPVRDDAWVRLDLPKAAHLGKVILHWQEAFASTYRVQTSSDGRTWTTVATVRDGRGGREEVRMDAPGSRHLRIQGVERGTKYGYSLFSVEAYAVTGS